MAEERVRTPFLGHFLLLALRCSSLALVVASFRKTWYTTALWFQRSKPQLDVVFLSHVTSFKKFNRYHFLKEDQNKPNVWCHVSELPFKPVFKKAKKGFRGYPIATVAFYGPDDGYATKVAVGIVMEEGAEPAALKRWKTEGGDVRINLSVGKQVADFILTHGVRSVVAADRIIGCPREEGTDYPAGEYCRRCPFWAARNRFSGRIEH